MKGKGEPKKSKGGKGIISVLFLVFAIPVALAVYYFGISENSDVAIQRAKLWTGMFDTEKRQLVQETEATLSHENYNVVLKNPEGEEFLLERFKDKTLFINFWASWCAPCIAEMPTIEKLYQSIPDESDIEIVLISVDEEPESAERFIKEGGFQMPYYFLDSVLPENLQYAFIPTTFVISPNGNIIYKNEGMADYNSGKFKEWLLNVEEAGTE